MKQWSLPLAALILLILTSWAYTPGNQPLIFDTSSNLLINYQNFLSTPGGCPSCLSIADYSTPKMIAIVDDQHRMVEVYLTYTNFSASPPVQPVANAPIMAYLPLNAELRLVYTDENGMALFNLTPYDKGTNKMCQKILFIYCPFSNGCGFEQCLNMTNITQKTFDPTTVSQYPVNGEMGITPALGTYFIPSPVQLPETYSVMPAVYAVPFCPISPKTVDTGSTEFCLPFLLILALLVGALQISGKNPFTAFDLATPRVTHHIRYEPRMRGVTSNLSALFMAWARSPMDLTFFSQIAEGAEEKFDAGMSDTGKPAAKATAAPAPTQTIKGSGGKVQQVQTVAPRPVAKTPGSTYKSIQQVRTIVGAFVPFVGLGGQIMDASGLSKAVGISAAGPLPQKKPGESKPTFGTSLGSLLALTLRVSNIYIFLAPVVMVAGGRVAMSETRDGHGNQVATGGAGDEQGIMDIFKYMGSIPLIGIFFKWISTRSEANAVLDAKDNAQRTARTVAETQNKFNVNGKAIPQPDLSGSVQGSFKMGDKSVDGVFLAGYKKDEKGNITSGFAFFGGQIYRVENGKVVTELGPTGTFMPTYMQVKIGGASVFVTTSSGFGENLKFTGTVLSASGARVDVIENRIVAMDVNGEKRGVTVDPQGRLVIAAMEPVSNTSSDWNSKLKALESRTSEGGIQEAAAESLKTGKAALVATYDGATLQVDVKKTPEGNLITVSEVRAQRIDAGSPNYENLPSNVKAFFQEHLKENTVVFEGKNYSATRDTTGQVTGVNIETQERYGAKSAEFGQIFRSLDADTKVNLIYDPKVNTITAPGGVIYNVERDQNGYVTGLAASSNSPVQKVVGDSTNPLTLSSALGLETGKSPQVFTINDLTRSYGANTGISMDLIDPKYGGASVMYARDGQVKVSTSETEAKRMDVSLGTVFLGSDGKPTDLLIVKDEELQQRLATPGTESQGILATAFRVQPDGTIINAHTGETLDSGQRAALLGAVPDQSVSGMTITLRDPAMISQYGTNQLRFEQTPSGDVIVRDDKGKALTGRTENEAMMLARDTLPKDCWLGHSSLLDSGNTQLREWNQATHDASVAQSILYEMFSSYSTEQIRNNHPAIDDFQSAISDIAKKQGTITEAEEKRLVHEAAEKAAGKDKAIDLARDQDITILEKSANSMLHPPGGNTPLTANWFVGLSAADAQEAERNWFAKNLLAGENWFEKNRQEGENRNSSIMGGNLVNNVLDLYSAASSYYARMGSSAVDPAYNQPPPSTRLDANAIGQGVLGDLAMIGQAMYSDKVPKNLPQMYKDVNSEMIFAKNEFYASSDNDIYFQDQGRRSAANNLAIEYKSYMDKTGEKLPDVSAAEEKAPSAQMPAEKPAYEADFERRAQTEQRLERERKELEQAPPPGYEEEQRLLKKRQTHEEEYFKKEVEPYVRPPPPTPPPETPPETPPPSEGPLRKRRKPGRPKDEE